MAPTRRWLPFLAALVSLPCETFAATEVPDSSGRIAFLGVRPTTDGTWSELDLGRLPEAQELRSVLETLITDWVPGLAGHIELRRRLGPNYLAELFECEGQLECELAFASALVEAGFSTAVVVSVYGRKRNFYARFRVLDLSARRIKGVHDIVVEQRQASRAEAWKAKIASIFTNVGNVSIVSNVADAMVSIDGRKPAPNVSTGYELSAGDHVIELSRPGYSSKTTTVSVAPGDSLDIAVALERETAGSESLFLDPQALQGHPRTWRIPGTATAINVGGMIRLRLDYQPDGKLGVAPTPFFVPPKPRRRPYLRLDARNSRFWIKTWSQTSLGQVTSRVEVDFLTGTDERYHNGSSLRLRHALASIGGRIEAGQGWSSFGDILTQVEAPTAVGAGVFQRNPMLRVTLFRAGPFTTKLAFENPETIAVPGPGGLTVVNGSDVLPDTILSLRVGQGALFGGAAFMVRRLVVDDGAGIRAEKTVWAGRLSWRVDSLSVISVGGLVAGGPGAGRYLFDARVDAVLAGDSAENARLVPQSALSTHQWVAFTLTDYAGFAVYAGLTWVKPGDVYEELGVEPAADFNHRAESVGGVFTLTSGPVAFAQSVVYAGRRTEALGHLYALAYNSTLQVKF